MGKKIIICSSVKFCSLVKSIMIELKDLGYVPVFPNLYNSSKEHDADLTKEEIIKFNLDHFRAIEESDAVYFILPKGYMGTSCKIELGYALALKKPIYFSEPTNDKGLDIYPKKFISLENLKEFNNEFN